MNSKFVILIIFFNLLIADYVKYGAELYLDAKNARNMGMGGYSISYSSGSNPAIIEIQESPLILFSHKNKYLGLSSITSLSYLYSYSISDKNFPIYIALLNRITDDIPDTRLAQVGDGSIDYQRITYFSQTETGLILASNYLINNINVGLTIKPFYTNIAEYQSYGVSSDIGLQKSFLNKNIKTGIRIENLFSINYWSTGKIENYYPNIIGNMQFNVKSIILGLELGAKLENNSKINYNFGFEYMYNKILLVRSGISKNLCSFGLGLTINTIQFDYALLYPIRGNPFSNSHIINIGISIKELSKLKDKISP